VEWLGWVGVVVAGVAALVAVAAARRAQAASGRAADAASTAVQHGNAAQRRSEAAAQQASLAKNEAHAVARSVAEAQEQLAVARQQAGNVGTVEVAWVPQWRHGPVFGLLRVQAARPHPLHEVHLSIVAPRRQIAGVPAVAVLGDSPVDVADAEQRMGLPQGGDTALSNVMHTDVLVGDLRPGEPWHALVMCLSEADAIVFILDWTVGPARDRERARAELALPPPSPG
jgi:hypothetical protein